MNMKTNTDMNEESLESSCCSRNLQLRKELQAVLSWILTFPQVNLDLDAVGNHDSDNYEKNVHQYFEKSEVALEILKVVEEICYDTASATYGALTTEHELSHYSDASSIWKHVHELANVNYQDNRNIVLSRLVHIAVSDQCRMREVYISRIMKLEEEVQSILMKIIQGGMADNISQREKSPPDEKVESTDANSSMISTPVKTSNNHQRNKDEEKSVGFVTSLTFDSSGYTPSRKRRSISPRMCDTIVSSYSHASNEESPTVDMRHIKEMEIDLEKFRDENQILQRELRLSKSRESDLVSSLDELKGEQISADLAKETDGLKREREVKEQYEKEISNLRKQLIEADDAKREIMETKKVMANFKDEIDILQHSQKRLSVVEEQLRKCRLKVQELADVKDTLVKEERAHNDAVSKCLGLENQVATLQPLRRQLETYKDKVSVAEVKLAECEHELGKARTLTSILELENKKLKKESEVRHLESNEIYNRLLEEGKQKDDNAHAIGCGISELNPELQEEILRLRNQNKQLNEYASKRTDDNVDKLEDNLDDAERLAKKFRSQFLTVKTHLESTQRALAESRTRENDLNEKLDNLRKEIKDLEKKLFAEQTNGIQAAKDSKQKLEQTIAYLEKENASQVKEQHGKLTKIIQYNQEAADKAIQQEKIENQEMMVNKNKQLGALRSSSDAKIQKITVTLQAEIKRKQEENDAALEASKAEAKKDREKLIEMGKNMLEKAKTEEQRGINELTNKHKEVVADMKKSIAKYRAQMKEYDDQVKAKLCTYKHKLHVSNGVQNQLKQDCEDKDDQIKKLERELYTAKEEYELFRRHMGNKLGAESTTRNQLESLQAEYNSLLEEHIALKKRESLQCFQMHEEAHAAKTSNSPNSKSSHHSNKYAVSQLQGDYEEKIKDIVDEKRQLIMTYQATVTDLNREKQRSWQLEEKLASRNNQITSMELTIERMERQKVTVDAMHRASHSYSTSRTDSSPFIMNVADIPSSISKQVINDNNSNDKENSGSMVNATVLTPNSTPIKASHYSGIAASQLRKSKLKSAILANHDSKTSSKKMNYAITEKSILDCTQPGNSFDGDTECKQS